MTMTDKETTALEEAFGPGTDDETEVSDKVLADFEGLPVVGSSIELPGAAGGLRDALKVDPVELHHGDDFYVTFKCKVRKVRFDPADRDEPDGDQHRVHIADVVTATLVGQELVGDALAAQAERIADAREQAKMPGQQSLGDTEPEREVVDVDLPPFLGYEDLTADEVVERIEAASDDDQDLIDAIARFEEANGCRAPILTAIKVWRDQ